MPQTTIQSCRKPHGQVGEAGQANNALHFNGSQSTLQSLVKFQHTLEETNLISQLFCR